MTKTEKHKNVTQNRQHTIEKKNILKHCMLRWILLFALIDFE